MLKSKHMLLPLLTLLLIVISDSAFASKQCIKNESGTVLDVTWYNQAGKRDKNASNHSLSLGFKACQDNANLGWAVIKCSGCIFAELAAQGAVTLGGAGAYGVCVAVTSGGCAMAGGVFSAGTAAAVAQIPPAFKGKKIAIPDKGKTLVVSGTAFKLKVH